MKLVHMMVTSTLLGVFSHTANAEITEGYIAKVEGTSMKLTLTRPGPKFVVIRLNRGYRGISSNKLTERMQVAVNMLTGCSFDPAKQEVDGRVVTVYVDKDCWYNSAID